jgi:hypothetical protein
MTMNFIYFDLLIINLIKEGKIRLLVNMAVTAAMKSGPCLCDASATCPRISPPNLGTSYFKDKVIRNALFWLTI